MRQNKGMEALVIAKALEKEREEAGTHVWLTLPKGVMVHRRKTDLPDGHPLAE